MRPPRKRSPQPWSICPGWRSIPARKWSSSNETEPEAPDSVAVNHPIDRTLAILKDVMSAHTAALSGKPDETISGRPSVPQERHSALALRLMQGVERHAGLEFGPALAEKLLALVAPMSLGALEIWVMELERQPPDAPAWQSLSESLTVH